MGAVRNRSVAKIQSTYVREQNVAEITKAHKRKLLLRRLSLFMIFAIIISYFMISSYVAQTFTLDAKISQSKQLNKQLSDLKKQQGILKEDIVKLNDNDYIAKLARKDYFFSNSNEIIFNIPEEKKVK